jgi:hypothetical protein
MVNLLGNQVNKLILVSIPSVFKDDEPRLCKLIAIEPPGLWLEGADLNTTLFENARDRQSGAVFVPFSQIVYLLEGTITTKVAPTESELAAIKATRAARETTPKVVPAPSGRMHAPATKSARRLTRKAK